MLTLGPRSVACSVGVADGRGPEQPVELSRGRVEGKGGVSAEGTRTESRPFTWREGVSLCVAV
jgi:hypothetical protein